MTSTQTTASTFQPSHLGTVSVIAWAGAHADDGRDMPFLLAYSLGDGAEGPEGSEAAVRLLIENSGLPVGAELVDGSKASGFPVKILVQSGTAVLTLSPLSAQCTVPPEWISAAQARGQIYFMFATQPWPQATPGLPVSEEDLAAFVGEESMMATAAHCLVPVSSLRA